MLRAKQISNWLLGEFSRLCNTSATEVDKTKITPEMLGELIGLTQKGAISGPASKQVFETMFNTGKSANIIVAESGLSQISSTSELENMAVKIIVDNPQAVTDYRAGKETALKFLVGQMMRVSKGRANPQIATELLKNKLEGK